MDRAYSLLEYAGRFAGEGSLFLNPGLPCAGSSSLLWSLLCMPGFWLFENPALLPLLLGPLASLLGAILLFDCARDFMPRGSTESGRADRLAAVAACAYALCPVDAMFRLSGVETPLFLLLGMASLAAWRRGKNALAGLLLGMLVLTRADGALLLPAFLIQNLFEKRRPCLRIPLLLGTLGALVLRYIYHLHVSGNPLFFYDAVQLIRLICAFPPHILPISVDQNITAYTDNWTWFIAWMVLLGGPLNGFISEIGRLITKLPYPFFFFIAAGIYWALKYSLNPESMQYKASSQTMEKESLSALPPKAQAVEAARSCVPAFLFWGILLNLGSMLILPIKGLLGAYQAVNIPASFIFLISGFEYCLSLMDDLLGGERRKPGGRTLFSACIFSVIFIWITDCYRFSMGWGHSLFNVGKICMLSCAIQGGLWFLWRLPSLRKWIRTCARKTRIQKVIVLPAILLFILCAKGMVHWGEYYRANLTNLDLHSEAGSLWIDENVGPGARIAGYLVSALRFRSGTRIVEITDLIEPDFVRSVLNREVPSYLYREGYSYFIYSICYIPLPRGRRKIRDLYIREGSGYGLDEVYFIQDHAGRVEPHHIFEMNGMRVYRPVRRYNTPEDVPIRNSQAGTTSPAPP